MVLKQIVQLSNYTLSPYSYYFLIFILFIMDILKRLNKNKIIIVQINCVHFLSDPKVKLCSEPFIKFFNKFEG